MEKIDRLGWADGLAITAHGARLGIRVTRAAALDRLPGHFPPAWKPASSPVVDSLYSLIVGGDGAGTGSRRYHLLYVGSERLARTMELDELLEVLESDLHFRVAISARRRLFVHAGVVGWRGRAIVIPGVSRSGKSTLVAALVRAGGTYYSDEYAVLDTHGRVHPYSRPIALRGSDGEPTRKLAPEALGGRAGNAPLPIGLVALTAFRAGARWRPRQLSPAEAVLGLMEHTVLARLRPGFAMKILRNAAAGALTLRGSRGEADQAAVALLRRVDSDPNLVVTSQARSSTRRVGSSATC